VKRWELWSWAGGVFGQWAGPLQESLAGTVDTSWAQLTSFFYTKDFPNIQMIQTCKIRSWYFYNSKNFQTYPDGGLVDVEQTFFVAQHSNLSRF
jgi:hypothetical protein